ncbi:uncharacterized protein O9250_010444 isoform 6-T6 [Rhynochetos jubatus]
MRSEDTGGSSQVSRVTDGKGGEKEKEVSEPAKSPGSAQRESCTKQRKNHRTGACRVDDGRVPGAAEEEGRGERDPRAAPFCQHL